MWPIIKAKAAAVHYNANRKRALFCGSALLAVYVYRKKTSVFKMNTGTRMAQDQPI